MFLSQPSSWIEIDSTAFNQNIAHYRTLLGPHTQLSVVVKSNAYGHGIKEIGTLCQKNENVNWLCVTSLSEALLLRQHSITKPILVLAIVDCNPALAMQHAIDLPVFDLETLEFYNTVAKTENLKLSVHIKIDTGMSRFGFLPEQFLHHINTIFSQSHLDINGIFTHCAESPNPQTEFTLEQLDQFNFICMQTQKLGFKVVYKHAFSSAAVRFCNQYPLFNFVRIGAGAYGLQHFKDPVLTFPELSLQPVMAWKTHIAHIKQIPADSYIGYDRTYKTDRPTTIAYLPVGYFEGYDRRLSNIGTVRIADFYASVAGRVCMNVMMVAIPQGKTVHIGDQVILLGDGPGLTAFDIASRINSNNAREITSRINANIARIII